MSEITRSKNIDLCCMQETELLAKDGVDLVTLKGYTLHLEQNMTKSRCGIYIKSNMSAAGSLIWKEWALLWCYWFYTSDQNTE